ncbi:MAG: tetratricopeptide repeat protein [Elusimicrobia bacterium]|nr:tetratricopeptide repeat protein [Elusimicrobiota bacterium]
MSIDTEKNSGKDYNSGGIASFEEACVYDRNGEYRKAAAAFKKAVKEGFNRIQAGKNIARMLRMLGDYDEAAAELKRITELDPRDGEPNAELARIHESRKDYTAALKELKTALEKGYDTAAVRGDIGRVYGELGDYRPALDELARALDMDRDNPAFYITLGRIHEKKQDYDSALAALKKAAEKGCGPEISRRISGIYSAQGRYDEAAAELGKALAVHPGCGELHAELSFINGFLNRTDEAARECKKAVEQGYEDARTRIRLGEIYREEGRFDMSVKEFEKALEISPAKNEKWFRNMILNQIEVSDGKTFLESKPRVLGAVLTTRCNLQCTMCDFVGREILDLPYGMASGIKSWFPYMEKVLWHGGEVFLYEHFEELFEAAAQYPSMQQSVITNGLFIDRRWAEKFSRANINLSFSIDGFGREIYEKIRKGAEFGKLLKCLGNINEYKKNSGKLVTSLIFVVMKSNYTEIDRIADFAREYGFDDFSLIPVHHVFTQENIFLHQDERAGAYLEKVIPELEARAREYNICFRNMLPAIGGDGSAAEPAGRRRARCLWPWQYLFLDVNYGIRPNCRCRKVAGSVYDKAALDDIWNNEVMREYRKKILEDDYEGLCDYRMSETICRVKPI